MSQSERILITGSGGQLGCLIRAVRARDGADGLEIVCQSRRPGADLVWSPGDPLSALPRCATLVALWGVTSGDADALAENERLVDQTFDISRHCGATRVLHLSTAGVYGPGASLAEDAPLNPIGEYGRSKIAMERRITDLRATSEAAHIVLRLANVVGADSLAPALRGTGPVTLDRFADHRGPRRSYIAASDVLRVFCHLARPGGQDAPYCLNVAAPEPVEMAALVQAADKRVVWRDAPKTAVQNVSLDATRLSRLLAPRRLLTNADELIADWSELET